MPRRRPLDPALIGYPTGCGTPIAFLPDTEGPGGGGGAPAGAPAPAPAPSGQPAGEGAKPPGKLEFDQDTYNRHLSREHDKGGRQALTKLGERYGFGSEQELHAALAKVRESDDAKLTEAERAKADADRMRAEAEAERQAAKRERTQATAERVLTAAGAQAPHLLWSSLTQLGVTVESDEAAIKDAVEQLKAQLPGAFTPAAPAAVGDPGKPPSSSPGAAGASPMEQRGAQGMQFAEQYKARAMNRGGRAHT